MQLSQDKDSTEKKHKKCDAKQMNMRYTYQTLYGYSGISVCQFNYIFIAGKRNGFHYATGGVALDTIIVNDWRHGCGIGILLAAILDPSKNYILLYIAFQEFSHRAIDRCSKPGLLVSAIIGDTNIFHRQAGCLVLVLMGKYEVNHCE